ncbi:MAG: hypothetical protein ACE5DM_01170 [Candidatus Nanoarchaeia archaeon]
MHLFPIHPVHELKKIIEAEKGLSNLSVGLVSKPASMSVKDFYKHRHDHFARVMKKHQKAMNHAIKGILEQLLDQIRRKDQFYAFPETFDIEKVAPMIALMNRLEHVFKEMADMALEEKSLSNIYKLGVYCRKAQEKLHLLKRACTANVKAHVGGSWEQHFLGAQDILYYLDKVFKDAYGSVGDRAAKEVINRDFPWSEEVYGLIHKYEKHLPRRAN